MQTVPKFEVHDDIANICQHCATIAAASLVESARHFGWSTIEDTATCTFLHSKGSTYIITAKHVLDALTQLDALSPEDGLHRILLPMAPGLMLSLPFIQPTEAINGRRPDIALARIPTDCIPHLSKAPIEITQQAPCPNAISFAVAAGFPTSSKTKTGEAMNLPCVRVVAEREGSIPSVGQIIFVSPVDSLSNHDVSGVSGGPVFWSGAKEFGLIGFVVEALPQKEHPDLVNFVCEVADRVELERWLDEADLRFNARGGNYETLDT